MYIPILVLSSIILSQSQITKSIRFSEDAVCYNSYAGYTIPKIKTFYPGITKQLTSYNAKVYGIINTPGEPQLPIKCLHFIIPENKKIKNIKVGTTKFKTLSGKYNIFPSQPPQIISISKINKFIEPNKNIYNSFSHYPGKLVEFVGEGTMRGNKVGEILIYPLQWTPKSGELKLYEEIELCIELEDTKSTPKYSFAPMFNEIIKSFVINPEDMPIHNASAKNSIIYEYLIVTSDSLKSAFMVFADWKAIRGTPTVIRTTEWINTNCSGRDLAEKIRNFIKLSALDSGLIWVLLGGDVDIVPSRISYAMTSNANIRTDEDSIHADLYYSDLEGTWDENENGVFGELQDNIDLYPDVFVGRAPVNNVSEATIFVNKTIQYEQNPPSGYLTNALFFAEILWTLPYTDAGISKDIIGNLFPLNFNIEKLYESQGNENASYVINAINNGKALLNHDGHGSISLMGVGPNYLYSRDVDTLTNGNAQGILYSIGCWVGAFDFDCIAEHWVRNPNGGGVAVIANSRYGWGAQGNPGYGYSDIIDEDFYFNLFAKNITPIGQTLAKTKLDYIPFSRSKNVYRWHQYQLNLLGDPQLDIWTNTPSTLDIACPDSLPVGQNNINITILSNGIPIQNVLVCCYKDSEVYEYQHTNELGNASFIISPSSEGNLLLTASCHNFYQHQNTIKIFDTGAHPGYYEHSFVDSSGNNEINPGEKIDLTIYLKNFGNQTATGVNATLRSQDSCIIITDSIGNFGDMPPGDIDSSVFSFRVSASCTNNHIIQTSLNIISFETFPLNFIVQAPGIIYQACSTSTIPYAGDTFDLYVTTKNSGGSADNVIETIKAQDLLYIKVIDSTATFSQILKDSIATGTYKIAVMPTCPTPYFTKLILTSKTGNYSFIDTFWLSIGQGNISFFEDFDTDTNGWTTGGTNSWLWTNHGSHSKANSFYCDTVEQWGYGLNRNCWLKSPEFILGPNSSLSFWSWFDVSTYGADGIYLEIGRQGMWDTLDFIASGGALFPVDSIETHFTNDWMPRVYSLISYPVGCTLQVRFNFISDSRDSGVAEGFYVDDITVGEINQMVPLLHRTCLSIKDSNGNDIVEAGEKIWATITLMAENSDFTSVTGVLQSTDPMINVIDDSINFGNIQNKQFIKGTYSFISQSGLLEGYRMRLGLDIKGSSYENRSEFVVRIGQKFGIEETPYQNIIFNIKPNPCFRNTIISYSLNGKTNIEDLQLTIYDLSGRLVKTFSQSYNPRSAITNVKWDAKDYPAGIYFVKLKIDTCEEIQKVILLK